MVAVTPRSTGPADRPAAVDVTPFAAPPLVVREADVAEFQGPRLARQRLGVGAVGDGRLLVEDGEHLVGPGHPALHVVREPGELAERAPDHPEVAGEHDQVADGQRAAVHEVPAVPEDDGPPRPNSSR
jgi:hypothetical protein